MEVHSESLRKVEKQLVQLNVKLEKSKDLNDVGKKIIEIDGEIQRLLKGIIQKFEIDVQKGHGVNRKQISSETYAKIGSKRELTEANGEDIVDKILNMGAESGALDSVEKMNSEIEDLKSKTDDFEKAKQQL